MIVSSLIFLCPSIQISHAGRARMEFRMQTNRRKTDGCPRCAMAAKLALLFLRKFIVQLKLHRLSHSLPGIFLVELPL